MLRGHVALLDLDNEFEALAIFHGPDAYISPAWYPTKAEGGRVVPTRNYAVVHAYGRMRAVDNASWLRAQLEAALTDQHEASLPHPWRVSDAPQEFTEKLLAAIVGIEMAITRLSGKWKVSQNQPPQNPQNQAGVIAGLGSSGTPNAMPMADLVGARLKSGN